MLVFVIHQVEGGHATVYTNHNFCKESLATVPMIQVMSVLINFSTLYYISAFYC